MSFFSNKKKCFLCDKKFLEADMFGFVIRDQTGEELKTDLLTCEKCSNIVNESIMKFEKLENDNDEDFSTFT